jgi:hypothetical protein
MGRHCSKLTIFEGCDGSGKSTAAKAYAKDTDAMYVHMGPLKGVTSQSLFRTTMDAMMPALLGHCDVVLDRAWPSEDIYGSVYRRGNVRLSNIDKMMLDRIALRCSAVVVLCDPGWDQVLKSFRSGRDEMLNNERQLKIVYDMYASSVPDSTGLPIMKYDWTKNPHGVDFVDIFELEQPSHEIGVPTTGNLRAKHLVIVDDTAYQASDRDHLHQPTTALPGAIALGYHGLASDAIAKIRAGQTALDSCYVRASWAKDFPHFVDMFQTSEYIAL